MTDRDTSRRRAIDAMATHLLAHGLKAARLRTLAAAAGTSDRMLLYYFADKDDLLAAVLGDIALRMQPLLDAAIPEALLAPAPLLARLRDATRTEALRPFMTLWLELAAAAARDEPPFRAIANAIAAGFHEWIAARLAPGDTPPHAASARLLTLIEGAALLDAIGRPDLASLGTDRP